MIMWEERILNVLVALLEEDLKRDAFNVKYVIIIGVQIVIF